VLSNRAATLTPGETVLSEQENEPLQMTRTLFDEHCLLF